jgi:hypothetical protein
MVAVEWKIFNPTLNKKNQQALKPADLIIKNGGDDETRTRDLRRDRPLT